MSTFRQISEFVRNNTLLHDTAFNNFCNYSPNLARDLFNNEYDTVLHHITCLGVTQSASATTKVAI